jgi:predicted metal-dependent phosphoesterase TrpH
MKQQGSKTGSIWRKWDLHIHTPASFVHWKGKSFSEIPNADHDETCKMTLQALNAADAAAFAIMDYWTFDGFIKLRQ